jgi:hypothetical protein
MRRKDILSRRYQTVNRITRSARKRRCASMCDKLCQCGVNFPGTRHARTQVENQEGVMLANLASLTVNPMFLRHDLLIELGRVELAISDIRNQLQAPANEHDHLAVLESRRATISQALGRIPA